MILLDTHAWIWWNSDPRRLSRRARKAIDVADEVAVAAISTWELAMLVARQRLTLDRDPLLWMRQALARERAELLPLSPEVSARSATMTMHDDPADRIIAATASVHGIALVTKDERIRLAAEVPTIW